MWQFTSAYPRRPLHSPSPPPPWQPQVCSVCRKRWWFKTQKEQSNAGLLESSWLCLPFLCLKKRFSVVREVRETASYGLRFLLDVIGNKIENQKQGNFSQCGSPRVSIRLSRLTPLITGHGNPLQYSCLENPMDREESGRLRSMGSQESDMTEVT